MDLMEKKNNNDVNITNDINYKKKIKLQPIKLKLAKSQSQPILLKNNKTRILSSIQPKNNKKTEKKLFNNANDYQFLYKDIRNTRFVVLWVKYLRNIPYCPGPVQHLGGSAPSFYEEDLESFRKRFHSKKKKLNKINLIKNESSKWKNLSISNEIKNKRYNEFLPHIIPRNDKFLKNEKQPNDENYNEKENNKSRYLHPFKYNYRNVTMDDGNIIKQRYIKYDDEITLKSPSLLFSSNKYNDKCNIKNYNNVKEYLNMANAPDLIKWQTKLRSYELPIKKSN